VGHQEKELRGEELPFLCPSLAAHQLMGHLLPSGEGTPKSFLVNYSWGMGVHSHNMGGAMLPEMMRWLWRDQPVSLDPHDTAERSFRSRK
jgi:hypothetical protein